MEKQIQIQIRMISIKLEMNNSSCLVIAKQNLSVIVTFYATNILVSKSVLFLSTTKHQIVSMRIYKIYIWLYIKHI